jgi:hypothetical protein
MTWNEVPYTKAPADQKTLRFRYDWLVNNPTYAGYALSSYSFSMVDSEGVDRSSTMIEGSPTNDSQFLKVTVKGGTDGLDYFLKGRVIFAKTGLPNYEREWDVLVQVREEGI